DCGGGEGGECARLHRAEARWLRHGGGGAGPAALGRRAAADRDCASDCAGAGDSDPGRGTSSVGAEREQRIHEAISRLAGRCTTFIIAHRLSTLQRVDRLLVLEEGRLVEIGTREQLMDRRQTFYQLVHMEQARISEMTTVDGGTTEASADIPRT